MKPIIMLIMLLFLPVCVYATPMLYSFEGQIIVCYASGGWNGPGSSGSDYSKLMNGQMVDLTYMIDLDNWRTSDVVLTYHSTNLIVNPQPGEIFTSFTDVTLGSGTDADPYKGFLYSNSSHNYLRLGSNWNASQVSPAMDFNWQVGELFGGYSFQTAGEPWGFDFRVTLMRTSAVPEPAIEWFLVICLAIIIGARYLRLFHRIGTRPRNI